MSQFKITYSNGFDIVEAKDIWAAAEMSRRAYKRTFLMPIKIEKVQTDV